MFISVKDGGQWASRDINADAKYNWQNKWAVQAGMMRLSSEQHTTQKAQPKNYLTPICVLNRGKLQLAI